MNKDKIEKAHSSSAEKLNKIQWSFYFNMANKGKEAALKNTNEYIRMNQYQKKECDCPTLLRAVHSTAPSLGQISTLPVEKEQKGVETQESYYMRNS